MKASASSVSRRIAARKYRIPVERIEFVRPLLSVDWSPEQITSVLTKAGGFCQPSMDLSLCCPG